MCAVSTSKRMPMLATMEGNWWYANIVSSPRPSSTFQRQNKTDYICMTPELFTISHGLKIQNKLHLFCLFFCVLSIKCMTHVNCWCINNLLSVQINVSIIIKYRLFFDRRITLIITVSQINATQNIDHVLKVAQSYQYIYFYLPKHLTSLPVAGFNWYCQTVASALKASLNVVT